MARIRIHWERNTVPKSMHAVEQAQKRRGIIGRPKRENDTFVDIKAWRIYHKYTQAELSKRLKVSLISLSRWERGIIAPPHNIQEQLNGVAYMDKEWPDVHPRPAKIKKTATEQDQPKENSFDPFKST